MLCRTIEEAPSLTTYVVWLGLDLGEDVDVGVPTEARLERFLAAFLELGMLRISQCPRAISIRLAKHDEVFLPNLCALLLAGFNLARPVSISHLHQYPLRWLGLLTYDCSELACIKLPKEPLSFPGILDVTLRIPSSPSSYTIVGDFADATPLILADTSSTPNFPLLLEFANPDLETLSASSTMIGEDGEFETVAPFPCIDDINTRFNKLTHLQIRGPFCSDKLFDHPLPLEYLYLGPRADVSTQRLLALVKGPKKLDTLSELHLEIVSGYIGTLSADEHKLYEDPSTGEYDVFPDWRLPEWTDKFSRCGAEVLLAAEEEGIEVTGPVTYAFEVEEAYEREEEYVASLEAAREDGVATDESESN